MLRLGFSGVCLWLAVSAAATWHLTRRSRPPFPEPLPGVEWARIEEHRVPTRDGETLGAWLWPGGSSPLCIVLCHGYNESRSTRLALAEMLARAGHSFLAISHRAHGDSSGEGHDFGWSARADVAAAVDLVEARLPGKRVIVLGHSLGAAAAVFAAGELGSRVGGYILESPYGDLKTAVRNRTRMYLSMGLDDVAYTGLLLWSGAFLPVSAAEISTLEHAADIPAATPVLLLAGTEDRHAGLDEIHALNTRLGSRSRLVLFHGASHSKLWTSDRELYARSVLQFLSGL
jgi:uncharacterized protein